VLGLVACQKSEAPPADGEPAAAAAPAAGSAAISDAARTEAKEIFALRCTPCHGPTGEGNGPASATLTPRPRNYTDQAWQKQVGDEEIEKAIQFGGAAVGKSPAMPPNPDLVSKPEVVQALRDVVRGFGKAK